MPVILGFPGGSDGKGSAYTAGYLGGEDTLEEGMATHACMWTEGPGRLQSMGSQRVGHSQGKHSTA